MNSYLRVSILGLAAGMLSLLTWVLALYLALAVFAIVFTLVEELAAARAAGMALEGQIGGLLGQSLVASGRNALHGLWDLRGAFVVLGLLGVLAAWGFQAGRLLAPDHAWSISFLAMAALVVIAVIAWIFVQRQQIALWMAESPETFRWRDILLESQVAAISVGPVFALAIAYPAWAGWRWWYMRLNGTQTFRHIGRNAPTEPAPPTVGEHTTYARRLADLKRGTPVESTDLGSSVEDASADNNEEWRHVVHSNLVLGLLALLLVGCLAGYVAANRAYSQIALRLQHGSVFVDATTQPANDFGLQIAPDVQRLRIVNINGLGSVSISLRSAANPGRAVGEVADWAFKWRADEYLYQDIPVQTLAPGDYILAFEQHDGWGYFEYMLSQGGGQASQSLAIASGLLLAFSIALAGIVAALVVGRLVTDDAV